MHSLYMHVRRCAYTYIMIVYENSLQSMNVIAAPETKQYNHILFFSTAMLSPPMPRISINENILCLNQLVCFAKVTDGLLPAQETLMGKLILSVHMNYNNKKFLFPIFLENAGRKLQCIIFMSHCLPAQIQITLGEIEQVK